MGRPPGRRNQDYEQTRARLARALVGVLVDGDGAPSSFKALARAAGVSEPTLKHYFVDRAGVVRAALHTVAEDARSYRPRVDALAASPPRQALRRYLEQLVQTMRTHGLGRIFAAGLTVGLDHHELGPAFLSSVLEPALGHAEQLLEGLQRRGAIRAGPVRAWAVSLVSPVVLAILHQDHLGGRTERALDMEEFIAAHLSVMVEALAAPPPHRSSGAPR